MPEFLSVRPESADPPRQGAPYEPVTKELIEQAATTGHWIRFDGTVGFDKTCVMANFGAIDPGDSYWLFSFCCTDLDGHSYRGSVPVSGDHTTFVRTS